MDLQENVFNALAFALSAPVVKYINEYDSVYPVVVYREISNIPLLFGDNREMLCRITYLISIGTANDEPAEIENTVESVMKNLGFTRGATNETFNGVYWREIKFSIIKEVS